MHVWKKQIDYAGIELGAFDWQASILPLNNGCMLLDDNTNPLCWILQEQNNATTLFKVHRFLHDMFASISVT